MQMHIYSANMQPATRWQDCHLDPPFVVECPGNTLIFCQCCHKRRPAKNAQVQSYYDCTMVWCAEGKGCKDPKAMATKKRREFRNRSNGQKTRWMDAGLQP